MRSLPHLLRLVCCGALACTAVACGPSEDNEHVVDAITVAAAQVYNAIETDSTWLVNSAAGAEVAGTLTGAGEMNVVGWRTGAEQSAMNGYHLSFAERLELTFNNWPAADVTLNGSMVLTRHSLDLGPDETQITEASRTTVYQGQVTATGSATGSFNIDVHGSASGNLLWTCGTVNDEPYGVGACY